jgi:uncharacterized protein (DUF302 family)
MSNFGFSGKLKAGFEQSIEMIQDGLKEQGFAVVSRIDMHSTFKEKINIDFKNFTILGACNAFFAHQVLVSDPQAGLLLPCNVTVEENVEGETLVSFVSPTEMLSLGQLSENKKIGELAEEVERRLIQVASKLF